MLSRTKLLLILLFILFVIIIAVYETERTRIVGWDRRTDRSTHSSTCIDSVSL